MKKIILLAAIAVCSITSYAQLGFGAQIGGNLGLGKEKYGYTNAPTLSTDPKVGFLIGVLAEIGFGKLAFRPELNFIQKGSKSGYSYAGYGGAYSATTKTTLNYVEIPLNVVYNLEIGKAGKVFFGLGPAIGIGLSGKYKSTGDPDTDITFDGKKEDPNDPDYWDKIHYKRVDVGLNILAGFKLPMGLFAKVGYTHGFSNIDANKDLIDYNGDYKNRGISLCIGYIFGKK